MMIDSAQLWGLSTASLAERGVEVPSVHQPIPSVPGQKGLPGAAVQAAPVVEKIYLRDQAVQSDPPPLGFDDNIIKDQLLRVAVPKPTISQQNTGVFKANSRRGSYSLTNRYYKWTFGYI